MARRRRSPSAALLRAFFRPPRPVRKKATRRKPAVAGRRPVRQRAVSERGAIGRPYLGSGTWLTATYSGPRGTRPYFIYVPSALRSATAVPLLVALHGCDQD